MATVVAIIWSILSLLVSIASCLAYLQPFWLVNKTNLSSLGTYSYCVGDQTSGSWTHKCGLYGGYFDFSHLPSDAWQAACLLYGGGCILLVVCALLASLSLCLTGYTGRTLAIHAGYAQCLAEVILVAGLVIYPLGFGSKFARHFCKDSHSFWAGDCEVGWAYMLAILSTALGMFCPVISRYTDMKIHPSLDNYNSRKAMAFV